MSEPVKGSSSARRTARAKKRAYSSPVREGQAAHTRERILDAAEARFAADGYARVTVKAIASAAGVAPDTVYAVFGTKARLLTALIDRRLVPRGDVPNVMDRPEAARIRDEPDQRRQLHLFAHDIAAVVERVRPVFDVLSDAAVVEPAMADLKAEMEAYRRLNMSRVVVWLRANGPLRLSDDEATDTLWALTGPDAHRRFCTTQGWSTEAYVAWLEDVLVRVLLPDA